ncbi:MAG: sigma-70 family RNA polymerase sigma factor [Gemmatimonadales bacterium]
MTEPVFDASFSRVFLQQFTRLLSYLTRLTGDPELASDFAQEALMRLHRRGTLPDAPGAWLVSVANNLFRDHRRSVSRRLELMATRPDGGPDAGRPPAADADLLADERRREVRMVLDRLPPRDRDLLLLRHSGYSYREIATALSVAETGVGTMLGRASEAFRRAYEEIHGAPD